MKTDILNIRDQWVQDLIWQHIVPEDFRPDYTKLDAIKHIETQIYDGNELLVGNEEVILRCVIHNRYVVEPHIMGNGLYFRSTMEAAMLYAKENTPFERAVVWTRHAAIGRIVEKCGFTLTGTVPRYHASSEGPVDLMHYVREIR
jgi:hypothetical protein